MDQVVCPRCLTVRDSSVIVCPVCGACVVPVPLVGEGTMNIETTVSKASWRFKDGVQQPAYISTFVLAVEDLRQALDTHGANAVAAGILKALFAEIRVMEGEEIGRT